MGYNLTLTSGFRSRSGSRLMKLWHPGPYRVPEDMSEDVAKQAVDAGVAVREKAPIVPAKEKEPPGVEVLELSAHGEAAFQEATGGSVDADADDDEDAGEDKPRKRGRPRKTPAPENKALKDAGENKS